MKATDELKAFVADLIQESEAIVLAPGGHRKFVTVNFLEFVRLHAGYRLLIAKLGPIGKVWTDGMPSSSDNTASSYGWLHGNLYALRDALDKGRLSTVHELVTAEILTDLLEQAEALLAANYHRPAAIILRTILEERLRKLCEANGCRPKTTRPTIEHYKQALYVAKIIDKIVQKKIDWMAGVGNTAAHNLPEYRDQDVSTLYTQTLDFLARFSA